MLDSTVETRFTELYVLADKEMLSQYGGDKGRVKQKIAGIVAIMNNLYKPFNIKFLISHIKVVFLAWITFLSIYHLGRKNRSLL